MRLNRLNETSETRLAVSRLISPPFKGVRYETRQIRARYALVPDRPPSRISSRGNFGGGGVESLDPTTRGPTSQSNFRARRFSAFFAPPGGHLEVNR